jgi:signal transduction histidine kinase
MKVGTRLFLATVPAILGVFTVAGLAYWGQYSRQAPHVLVTTAVVASVASLVMSWMNTRYVARRVARLAAGESPPTGATFGLRDVADAVTGRAIATEARDELDRIEHTVARLSADLEEVKRESTGKEEQANQRVREYGTLLADATADAIKQFDEVRLPLHILLENRFGELNENQEEMLAAARSAVEHAEERLRRLREIVEIDRGRIALRQDPVRTGDLITSLLPGLNAQGLDAGVEVTADLAPALPRVTGDRAKLQEACGLLLGERVKTLPPGSRIEISATPSGDAIRIDVKHPGGVEGAGADTALARRLIAASGGTVEDHDGITTITLPTRVVPPPGDQR